MAALCRRLRLALGQLRRSERGIALPMALMVTVVGMGLAAVPVVASINSQGGNQHNQGANEALAAAEAGAEWALHKQGALHTEEGDKQLCVSSAGVTGGWCPEEPTSSSTGAVVPGSVGLATYTYRVLSCFGTGETSSGCAEVASSTSCAEAPVEIVSTGVALVGGIQVKRRVEVTGCATSLNLPPNWKEELAAKEKAVETAEENLHELEGPGLAIKSEQVTKEGERNKLIETIAKEKAEGKKSLETQAGAEPKVVEKEIPPAVFSSGQVVGIEKLTMSNGANVYNGGVGSNGPISLTGAANACSIWMVAGQTLTVNNGSNSVPSYCTSGKTVVESKEKKIFPEVQLPANIATQNSDARLTGADPASGYNRGNINWNESKKELSLNYGELELEGTLPYYFCRLVLGGGGKLQPGAGKTIRIFFENPANCPSLNGAAQLVISNGADVMPDSGHGPGFYFVGSSTKEQSKIELAGGSSATQLVIYAPRSKITANNGITMSGTIIGQTLEIGGGATINRAGAFTPPTTTEFVAAEKTSETIQVPVSKEVETTLGIHEDELRTVETAIEALIDKIAAINEGPIGEAKTGVEKALEDLAAYEKVVNGESGSSGNSAFEKQSFNECSATSPNASNPASGC